MFRALRRRIGTNVQPEQKLEVAVVAEVGGVPGDGVVMVEIIDVGDVVCSVFGEGV